MKISINRYVVGRDETTLKKYNHNFIEMDLTRKELASEIQQGYAFCTLFDGKRNENNFRLGNHLAIDIDKGMTLKEAIEHPYVRTHAAFVYTTTRHQKEGFGDRFRIVFELETPITDSKEYRKVTTALMSKFSSSDKSCKDAIRLFYGSKDCQIYFFDGIITLENVDALLVEHQAEEYIPTSHKTKGSYKGKLKVEEIREMLSFIDPQPGYSTWRDITWAIGNEVQMGTLTEDEAYNLIKEWSPDDQDGEVICRLLKTANGKITIGTAIYHAQQQGYELPDRLKVTKSDIANLSVGQIALEQLFNNGEGYKTFYDQLYHYEDGYYQALNNKDLESRILNYLNVLSKNYNRKDLASSKQAKEALSYVKLICKGDESKLNPPGLNLSNGYLNFSITQENKLLIKLLPHSSEVFFTYKAEFEYSPIADSLLLDEILNDILPIERQTILFRVIAASFDLKEVRRRKGRTARALCLVGQGANGKDTIREWISKLMGYSGMSSISIQAFKKASKDVSYELAPLLTSKINWCPESAIVGLDTCEELKKVITGEEITIHKKFQDPITHRPNSIMIFNANVPPHLQSAQQAWESRIAFIEFENSFTTNPDLNNPREKKARPELKEDPEFINKNILPALLNRLLLEFQNLLYEGIDYSCTEAMMQEIRENDNHLFAFARDVGLTLCSLAKGTQVSKIFSEYERWIVKQGYTFADKNRKHNPSDYDRLIPACQQLTPALKKIFPTLEQKRKSEGSIVGLKITKPAITVQSTGRKVVRLPVSKYPLIPMDDIDISKAFDGLNYSGESF